MIRPRIADIITIAARLGDVTEDDVRDGDRFLHLLAVRFGVYQTAREWEYSFPVIGRAVGNRHHTTVMHSLANHDRYSLYVLDFDEFCNELSRWADELPPFVAETAWSPPRMFPPVLTKTTRQRQVVAPQRASEMRPKRPAPDYDVIMTERANAAMRRGSDQLMAALARAA